MGLTPNRRPPLRSFRFEFFHFAEALVIESVLRRVRGAQQVFPTGRPFPKKPAHPSAIALFDDEPRRRLLIESPRRVAAGLRAKRGFSKLEAFYGEMIAGMRKAHKGDPLALEFWSFDDDDQAREAITTKLARRLDAPVEWVAPHQIADWVEALRHTLGDVPAERDDLCALLALLDRLPARAGEAP